jgi:hypothetical protein
MSVSTTSKPAPIAEPKPESKPAPNAAPKSSPAEIEEIEEDSESEDDSDQPVFCDQEEKEEGLDENGKPKKECCPDPSINYRIRVFGPYNPEDENCNTDLSIEYNKRVFPPKDKNPPKKKSGSVPMWTRFIPPPAGIIIGQLLKAKDQVDMTKFKAIKDAVKDPTATATKVIESKLKGVNESVGKMLNPDKDGKKDDTDGKKDDKKPPTIGGTRTFFTEEECSFF